MKVYLAGRYDRRLELCGYADELRREGHTVDCRWLLGTHQLHPSPEIVDIPNDSIPMEAAPFAQDDVEDIFKADTFIVFSERPDSHSKRGGRHVEFGIALSLRRFTSRQPPMRLVVIGPRENVFHCLPEIEVYGDWASFMSSTVLQGAR